MLKKLRKMLKQQEGFTLVELMIVVVILGIISGIGIQQYGNVQKRARETANDANIKIIKSAMQVYILMEPSEFDEDEIDGDGKTVSAVDLVNEGYLETAPKDPYDKDQVYTAVVKQRTGVPGAYDITVELKPSEGGGGEDPK